MDLGGQFLNARHHPPLLRQRRQHDFLRKKFVFLEVEPIRCAFARSNTELHEHPGLGEIIEELRKHALVVSIERPEIAGDDCVVAVRWENSKRTVTGVNL